MVELAKLVDLLHAETQHGWRDTLFGIGRDLGFEQVLVGIVPSRHARLEAAFLHSNYSPKWRDTYDHERLAYIDPTVGHCMASSLPIVWQPDTFSDVPQRALYEEACGYGIRSGITFPIHGPAGEFGVISFASDDLPGSKFDAAIARTMGTLSLVRDYAFASSLKFLGAASQEAGPHLTRREREILNWVMVGKSSWEISRITACSEATVNFHVANIRKKFNVSTRQQALVKAISLGMITPEDPYR